MCSSGPTRSLHDGFDCTGAARHWHRACPDATTRSTMRSRSRCSLTMSSTGQPDEPRPAASGEEQPLADVRDYLAEERTVLAWIRTGLALMGFGFVVARFGLFLQELRLAQGGVPEQTHVLSPLFGTALIAV